MTTADYLEQLQQDREDLVDNLEAKGITGLTGDETFTELVPEVLNIPSGGSTEPEEKDVNFYDYDGTRVYSYTKAEFLQLTEFPANPTHEGLTSQGWNWDWQNAVDYVTTYGLLDLGQMYNTSDNALRIYVELTEKTLSSYLGFFSDGTTTIDWGDGSTPDTRASSSTWVKNVYHTYSQAGKYVISMTTTGSYIMIASGQYGATNYPVLLRAGTDLNPTIDPVYWATIKKIELSSKTRVNTYSLTSMYNLETITTPNNISFITDTSFGSNYMLKCIIIPKNITNNVSLSGSYMLKKQVLSQNVSTLTAQSFKPLITNVSIPSGITTLPTSAFSNNYNLKRVIIPSSVTTISNNSFNTCCYLEYVDFSHHTNIPTLSNTNAFNTTGAVKIIVPDSLYEDWIVANNWSSLSSQIIKKTDWDALNS